MSCVIGAYNFVQTCVFSNLKEKQSTMCGDMRCDDPGFSAKYGAYTFMVTLSPFMLFNSE